MHKRCIPLVCLIAASLTTISACRSGDSAGAPRGNGLVALLSEREAPRPRRAPNSAAGEKAHAEASKPSQAEEARFQALRAQIDAIRRADQKRMDEQARRIGRLETTVEDLKIRLRRLAQPEASSDPSGKPSASAPSAAAAARPAASVPERTPKPSTPQDARSQRGDDPGDGGDSRGDAAISRRSAPSAGHEANRLAGCPRLGDPARQFDVFFRAASHSALTHAAAKVKSAGFTDWFTSSRRLYLGRYDKCPVAARRRDAVHARTGLLLSISTVRPSWRRSAARRAKPSFGASAPKRDTQARSDIARRPRPAESVAVRSATASAPFRIVGVEIRGTHRYLGLAPHGANRLSDISWLAVGGRYAHWTLQAIRTEAGTATFLDAEVGNRTIIVKLPNRG